MHVSVDAARAGWNRVAVPGNPSAAFCDQISVECHSDDLNAAFTFPRWQPIQNVAMLCNFLGTGPGLGACVGVRVSTRPRQPH